LLSSKPGIEMRAKWMKRILGALVLGLAVAGLVWFAWPQPIPVDLATVLKGPMEVTVDDEGKTRVRDIYTVSAPLAGTVLRLPGHIGDHVVANDTVIAVMQAMTPGFHDVRTHEELQAGLAVAEAAVTLAEHEVHRIETGLEFSRSELQRAERLARTNTITVKTLEKAKIDAETNEAALASAKAQLEVRRSERTSATARLTQPSNGSVDAAGPACCLQIRAPVSGRILRISQESEAVVQAGSPLIEIGDPSDLEIVTDLLSTDAVLVTAGSRVRIDGWGGPEIRGRVARVDPAGFVKISALGIEEQRVRTTVDFVDPPEVWSRLGHDFRVIVHIPIWSASEAITVPVAALFRKDENWAVFTVNDGRTRLTPVQIGQRNNRVAEVVSGLSAGEQVVLHPSDRIQEGVSVSEREIR
jgi:HlyD family secretion protein